MKPDYHCVTAVSLAEIEPHRAAWQGLMPRALEDNFYLSPDFLSATLRHLAAGRWLIVFVYRRGATGERLVAVAPFSRLRPGLKRPFSALSGFTSPHGYLSHPLLDRDDADSALDALWQWLERPSQPWQMISFHGVNESSPFLPRLRMLLERRGRHYLSKPMFLRPMLKRHGNFDEYLASLPAARRKNYRRRWKQLQADGRVEVALYRELAQAGDLADRFLQLEHLGWKGSRGTAMACAQHDTGFFREVVERCGGDGRLFFVELNFNGRPIAMTANFVTGRTLFAFKIAYDPAYQDYSPGILAEVQTARLFHQTPELTRGEGGATHLSYLRSYWRDLAEMRGFHISLPRPVPRAYLALLSLVWRTKQLIRRAAHRTPELVGLKMYLATPTPVSTGNEVLLATSQLL